MNMFKSDIFTIRKVRSEANIKCFEFFGQPTLNLGVVAFVRLSGLDGSFREMNLGH